MRKRANGEGTIFCRSDGRWCASLSVEGGRRKHFLGRTRAEVARKLREALKARDDGLPVILNRETLAEFLQDWLVAIRPALRERTWVRYEQYVRLHIVPSLGKLPLERVAPQHLQHLYANQLARGLAPATVHHLHACLHRALKQAVRWNLLARNVAELVDPPRIPRHEMTTLTPAQARDFLAEACTSRLHALFVLAITTGMREGELLGLHWRNVNFASAAIEVRGSLQRTQAGLVVLEPKTERSRRQVRLTRAAVDALQQQRRRQLEERLRLGPAWQDDNLVFTDTAGGPIEATAFLRNEFWPLLRRASLPRIRFHDLRHTAATLLLGQGVHPKIVSEMLGHSQVGITLDLYSHVTPTMQQAAVDAMDRIVTSA